MSAIAEERMAIQIGGLQNKNSLLRFALADLEEQVHDYQAMLRAIWDVRQHTGCVIEVEPLSEPQVYCLRYEQQGESVMVNLDVTEVADWLTREFSLT